jgi:hypothetical protein
MASAAVHKLAPVALLADAAQPGDGVVIPLNTACLMVSVAAKPSLENAMLLRKSRLANGFHKIIGRK